MYKVLVADDETPIRDWLEICVNSTGCGCEVVAKASNGQAALEQYEKEHPDIIITDIRMPFMDGMDLISKIRERNSQIPVVILTSYTDFSYARQALQQGVTEYILKTEVTVERMKEILTQVIIKLEKKTHKNEGEYYQQERRRGHFLKRCISESNEQIKEEIATELRQLEIPLSEVNMAAVVFCDLDGTIINEEQFPDIRIAAVLSVFSHTALMLCNIIGQTSQIRQREILYQAAANIMERTGASVGISNVYSGFSIFPFMIKEAYGRFTQRFYDKRRMVHELEQFYGDSDTVIKLREYQQAFETSVKEGNYEKSRDQLLDIIKFMSIKKLSDIQLIRNTCTNMLKFFYYSYAPEVGKKLAHMEHIMAQIETSETMYEIEQFIDQNICQIQEAYDKSRVQYSGSIQRAIDFLQENYSRELTLPIVAAHTGFSPDYFSRIFKEETGTNFSTYLTRLRLKKALELLMTTNMKVYEVSSEVGYTNMSYFSTVFKKEYGVNPFDFKNSSKQEQNAILNTVK